MSESSGRPGMPTSAPYRTDPTEVAAAPFASGVPTVRCAERWAGGLQDAKASGGPCTRVGALHSW